MRAVQFSGYGGPEVVSYGDAPCPREGEGEILVRVIATGVNPVDWKTREGGLRAMRDCPMPFVPGWDAAGVVAEVGSGAEGFQPGDAVHALPGYWVAALPSSPPCRPVPPRPSPRRCRSSRPPPCRWSR